MRVLERRQDLICDHQGKFRRQATRCEDGIERDARRELGHEKRSMDIFAELDDRERMRMFERGERLRFARDATRKVVRPRIFRDEFHCDGEPIRNAGCAVYDSHRSRPEHRRDAIATADERSFRQCRFTHGPQRTSRSFDVPIGSRSSVMSEELDLCYEHRLMASQPLLDFPSLLTDDDLHWFNEGVHTQLYEKLGAHPGAVQGRPGTFFAVWAPNAEFVSVIGDFNGWSPDAHPMRPRASSGIWEVFVDGVGLGALYKFHIRSRHAGYRVEKADPFGFLHETPPHTASIVWDLSQYAFGDRPWMNERAKKNSLDAPMSIYELHLGSWARVPEEHDRVLGYRELAPRLADYVIQQGYTHVELMPVMEHPFGGSWGYQVTGYFAPTHRQGKPEDFMWLIDHLHQRGIGVILDWVPAHFPTDQHGLSFFDGTHLFEHADPRQGFHPDWRSSIFNYGRHEVRSFLLSSALFWLERYHADALRVDGVASMLYLDYSRASGEWIPNEDGGRENRHAVTFLKTMNEHVYRTCPDVQTIAEESTSFPNVSRPTFQGGLGFGLKWDLGWMHDTLRHFERDPVHRRFHHNELTFRSLYAWTENFVLPLSHDEVVHGKGSLINKMPGDRWQKFAHLRLLFGYQFAQPGKKLIFMGGDFAQWREWNHDQSLDWHLTEDEAHHGVLLLVRDLNHLYRSEPAMHRFECEPRGFQWVSGGDAEHGVIAFLRRGLSEDSALLCVLNFTPVVRYGYRLGASSGGLWQEVLNTDASAYGGSGVGNLGGVTAKKESMHGLPFHLELTLPPLACVVLRAPGATP